MKVKNPKSGEILEVNTSYGIRLVEHGYIVVKQPKAKPKAKAVEPNA